MQTETSRDVWKLGQLRAAQAISNLTAPPLLAVPLYIVLGVYDKSRRQLSDSLVVGIDSTAVFFGVVFPLAFVLLLRSRSKISDIHIPIRQQRTLPYCITILSYLAGFAAIYWLAGAGALAATMFCYGINTSVMLFINFFWKISAHATGVGGPLAALTLLYGWVVLPLYLLLPMVGWARVHLKAHTLGQVVAGSILGFGLTAAQLLFIFRPLGWL